MSDVLATIVAYIILAMKFAIMIAIEVAIFIVFGRWLIAIQVIIGIISGLYGSD